MSCMKRASEPCVMETLKRIQIWSQRFNLIHVMFVKPMRTKSASYAFTAGIFSSAKLAMVSKPRTSTASGWTRPRRGNISIGTSSYVSSITKRSLLVKRQKS